MIAIRWLLWDDCYEMMAIHSFKDSFKDLYSTSSRKLLRGAPEMRWLLWDDCYKMVAMRWLLRNDFCQKCWGATKILEAKKVSITDEIRGISELLRGHEFGLPPQSLFLWFLLLFIATRRKSPGPYEEPWLALKTKCWKKLIRNSKR